MMSTQNKEYTYNMNNMVANENWVGYPESQIQQNTAEIQQARMEIWQNGKAMCDGMQEVIKKVDLVTRKKRRCKTSSQLSLLSDGQICIVDVYDDGTRTVEEFMMNVRGTISCNSVIFEKWSKGIDLFVIMFSETNIMVLGEINKVGGKYLYERFIKAGVKFNPNISKSSISVILFEHFAPLLEQMDSEFTVSALAGWLEGKFLWNESYCKNFERLMPGLPIFKKKFEQKDLTQEIIEIYFSELLQIQRETDRALIAEIPFLGIMSSILSDIYSEDQKCFNFVMLAPFSYRKICSWLQVFNRNKLSPIYGETSFEKSRRTLKNYNDEVLVLNYMYDESDSVYQKEKKDEKSEKLQTILQINGEVMEKIKVPPNVCVRLFHRSK